MAGVTRVPIARTLFLVDIPMSRVTADGDAWVLTPHVPVMRAPPFAVIQSRYAFTLVFSLLFAYNPALDLGAPSGRLRYADEEMRYYLADGEAIVVPHLPAGVADVTLSLDPTPVLRVRAQT